MNKTWPIFFITACSMLSARGTLISHWQFNNAGNVGEATVGTTVGSFGDPDNAGNATYTAMGKFGGALTLPGDSFLSVNTALNVPVGTPIGNSDYTVAAWIKTSEAASAGGIVGWGNFGTGSQVNATRTNGGGNSGFQNYSWGAAVDLVSPPVGATSGDWHHIAAVYDSATTTKTLYFNGVSVASKSTIPTLNVGAANFRLGATIHPFGKEYFNGALDDVRIYDNALSDTQVLALANAIPEPSSFALVALGLLALRLKIHGVTRKPQST